MRRIASFISLVLISALSTSSVSAQKVGVVLSGGGASGMAHIGVLSALEENGIPIDCIAGTSMGAVVAGLYASGTSIETMERFFSSEQFVQSVNGKIDERFTYYFKQYPEDASIVTLKIDLDTLLLRTIPAYVVSPVEMDMAMMETVSEGIAVADYDFDDLMVPFRCVASDITKKESVIFRNGELHKAIRASASFPFYFKPIEMDGRILFDGGLYNNFPSDVLYEEFAPDIIIGSSVSIASPPVAADDLFSQLENMIVSRLPETIPSEKGLIIRPQTGLNTLDFEKSASAIGVGYEAASELMDSISNMIERRVDPEEMATRRARFNARKPELRIGKVSISGVSEKSKRYYRKLLRIPEDTVIAREMEEFKPLYYRIFGDDKIRYIYPSIRYNKVTGLYDLEVHLEKERDLFVDFGGTFSSRPVNTGYLGLKYNLLGKTPKTFYINSYFGKFYNSLLVDVRFDFAGKVPFYLSGGAVGHQWDYFRSFNTFFQESRPSFILQNEGAVNLEMGIPAGNRGKIMVDGKYGRSEDEYYETEDFTPTDTADVTTFRFNTVGLTYERNSLNRKLYASRGTYLSVRSRYVDGIEETTPGSTGFLGGGFKGKRQWVQFQVEYENYFKRFGKLGLGLYAKANYSNQPFFSNYKATILSAPFFQPIPESRTIFQEEFRAYRFGAGGVRLIYGITPNLEIRGDSYIFQPVEEIRRGEENEAVFEEEFLRRFYIGSAAVVYHSPLGPLSVSVNYYDQRDEPWSWIINFGYLIFNKRALE